MIRFGANAIFEAKDAKDITDEDIDAILGLFFFCLSFFAFLLPFFFFCLSFSRDTSDEVMMQF